MTLTVRKAKSGYSKMMRSQLSVKMAHPTHFFSSTLTADLSLSVIVRLKGMLIKGEWGIGNGVNQIFSVSSSHQSGHRIGVKQIFAVSSSHQSDHRIGVKQIFAVSSSHQSGHRIGVKQIFAVSSSHQSDHRIGVKQIFAVCRRYQLDHSVRVYLHQSKREGIVPLSLSVTSWNEGTKKCCNGIKPTLKQIENGIDKEL